VTVRKGKPARRGDIHVALLRGVNVGGKNILPMKALAAMFSDAGCADVRTYIQSGNVLFEADAALAGRVPGVIGKAISARFGFSPVIVTRTAAELGEVTRHNPFLKGSVDTRTLHVGFLLDRPSKANLAALDPKRSPPDAFAPRGREIYLQFPNGMGRSKLTSQYFDSTLETTITVRNWNTVLKLLELARGG
jgi:uncharacterized protein (DUF1697 family)